MSQIGLVSNQHDDNVAISVIPQLLQPSRNILKRLELADVVDEQSSHGTAIVSRCDGAVAFLASRVPDLSLDGLGVDLDAARRKLHANCGFAVQAEFIACESRKKVRFTDAGVTDQDDCSVNVTVSLIGSGTWESRVGPGSPEEESQDGGRRREQGVRTSTRHRVELPLNRNCGNHQPHTFGAQAMHHYHSRHIRHLPC
jgi:hypothetical protein